MSSILVIPFFKHVYVVFQRFPAHLVMVDDPCLFPDDLDEEDGGSVVHPQVPESMHVDIRFVRNLANSVLRSRLSDLVSVVGSLDCGFEGNEVLLLY